MSKYYKVHFDPFVVLEAETFNDAAKKAIKLARVYAVEEDKPDDKGEDN